MQALYRKYRPQKFSEVAEQPHVVRTICNELKNNSVAHAYLFSGPRGVGKTTIARLLAKSLQCEKRGAGECEPCGECANCIDFGKGAAFDVVEVDAASQTGVDAVRENIIENVRFMPTRGKWKIFIIDEVHMLSTSSFNALLKTLEEPPAYVVFILATTEEYKLPATVVSRCQRFTFHRISAPIMIERLRTLTKNEGRTIDDAVLARIAQLSEGCLRDGESLLGQVLSLDGAHIALELASTLLPVTHLSTITALVDALARGQSVEALRLLRESVEGGASVRHVLDECLEYVRQVMMRALGAAPDELAYDAQTQNALADAAMRLGATRACALLDVLLDARGRQTPASFPQVAVEVALMKFLNPGPVLDQVLPVTPPSPQAPIEPPVKPKPPAAPAPAAITTPEKPYIPHLPAPRSLGEEGTPSMSLPDLQSKWQRCLDKAKAENPMLGLIISVGKPIEVQADGTVVISFPYDVHVEKMRQAKNSLTLSQAIDSVMMVQGTHLVFTLDKPATDAAGLDHVLNAFGGSIV